MRHGVRNTLRWSIRLGSRFSMDHRSSLVVRLVIHQVPPIRARTTYPGATTAGSHAGTSVKTLGIGNATAVNRTMTAIPTRLIVTMKLVRISWIRTRRRTGLSSILPSSSDP